MTNLLDPNPTATAATGVLFCSGTVVSPCSAKSTVGRTLVKPDKNNFAPRIGIAWRPSEKWVVRSGYGRFYMLFERAGSEDQMYLNPPWLINNSVTAANTASTANNMRLDTGFNLSLNPATLNLTTIRLRAVNPNNVQPEVDQWSLGVERQMPWQTVLTAEYVGTKGTHLSILRNLNQQYFDAGGFPTGVIPYANLGAIEFRDNVGNSTYHGLELSAQKRFSHDFSLTAAYTWSHSIDQVQEHLISGSGSNSFLQNEHDLAQQRGNSDFDFRQRLSFSYLYELPFGPGKHLVQQGPVSHILRGWRASGIAAFHTGRPFTIFSSNNNSIVQVRGGLTSALADCLGGGTLPSDQRTVDKWFDTSRFATPPGRLGTCGRNQDLRGPGMSDVDFALSRTFSYFGEGRSLEFRWETFNLLNTAYFGLPTNNVNSGSFGKITSLAGDPRVMQFALRFAF